jgi:hypothetical protein
MRPLVLVEFPQFSDRYARNLLIMLKECVPDMRAPLILRLSVSVPLVRISFRSLKIILGHSRVRSTATPKLALWAQTLGLGPFRFTKNGELKSLDVRSREPGQQLVQ